MDYTELFKRARAAAVKLQTLPDSLISSILLSLAQKTEERAEEILSANKKDLSRMSGENPMYDRLMLTPERISSIASDIRNVAGLPSPLGHVLERTQRPNGMEIRKVSVPFGVIGVIYEARPNVSFDVFSLCLKSGNACVLKGGSDASSTNAVAVSIMKESLSQAGAPSDAVSLLPAGHEAAHALLSATGMVDLVIPRGGRTLIDYVRDNAKVPVIETGAGICHTYFDKSGDLDKGRAIITNAKTRRVSVCNALDCLIIHRDRLEDLPSLCRALAEHNVVIFADEQAYKALSRGYPQTLLLHADENSFGTEFLSYRMAVKTVDSLKEALRHIAEYSSKHSEAIVAEDREAVELFQKMVDAACVYANVSTAFTDGAQFGFGAEIGISTQKLHARGPMALMELTTYKYLITGSGQTRP